MNALMCYSLITFLTLYIILCLNPSGVIFMEYFWYFFFMFEFPCIITLYYIKDQQDATLAVLFISHCKITLHVSDASCVHHKEY